MIVARQNRTETVMGTPMTTATDLTVFYYSSSLGEWQHWITLDADDVGDDSTERPYLLSPEVFVFDGDSYLLFSSAAELTFGDALEGGTQDGNIWVVKLSDDLSDVDGDAVAWSRQVNTRPTGEEARIRAEGEEYFVESDGSNDARPVIYYSWLEDFNEPTSEGYCAYGTNVPDRMRFTLRLAELCPPGVTGPICD